MLWYDGVRSVQYLRIDTRVAHEVGHKLFAHPVLEFVEVALEAGIETGRQLRFGESGLYSGETLKRLFDLEGMTIFFSGWGKLYKRNIIEENGIRMDTAYRITEDTDFAMRYLENCASVYLVDECFYRYMQVNEGSLTSVKKAESLRDGAANIAARQESLMLKWGMDEAEAARRSREYLYCQLNAAAFIKLRSKAKRAEKKAFYKEVMAVDGLKSHLRHGKLSNRALAAGFGPALAYTKLHAAYLNTKRRTRRSGRNEK